MSRTNVKATVILLLEIQSTSRALLPYMLSHKMHQMILIDQVDQK